MPADDAPPIAGYRRALLDRVKGVSETPLFVVVLTGTESGFSVAPRAIGPFDDYDVAQAFSLSLAERYEAEGGDAPTATVVRVEPDQPGTVIGEL